MKAVAVIGEGRSATLREIDIDVPEPGEHQLLVQIRAAGLNRADLRRTQQHHADGEGPHIAGLELAGEVTAVGSGVVGFAVGDRVMAMAPSAYAEFALADARTAMHVPEGLSWPEAAATPVWYMTAHNALVTEGGLERGKSVLIVAASSGVGLAAIQLARFLGARPILGTSSSRGKADRLAQLGLDELLVPAETALGPAVKGATGGAGADIIIDMVGGGILSELLEAAAPAGTIVSVGRMGGFTDTIDLDKLALKRLRLVGVTFRSLDVTAKTAIRDNTMRDLGPALASGVLRPVVDKTFPLSEALAAQEYMKENRHFGKVVLVP